MRIAGNYGGIFFLCRNVEIRKYLFSYFGLESNTFNVIDIDGFDFSVLFLGSRSNKYSYNKYRPVCRFTGCRGSVLVGGGFSLNGSELKGGLDQGFFFGFGSSSW